MGEGTFFDSEVARLDMEARTTATQAEEYRLRTAEMFKGVDRKALASLTETNPKPRRKPIMLRLRDFLDRIRYTLS